MSKLSLEEKEDLADLLHHEGVATLYKEMEAVAQSMERDVVQFNLSTSTVDELIHIKCRAEGARAFVRALRNRLDTIKRPNK